MKRILLAGVALAAMTGTSALAADQAPARMAPPYNWTGGYVGVHAGLAYKITDFGSPYGPTIFGDEVRSSGFLAGGQAGFNWQDGIVVYGIEADASGIDGEGTNTCYAVSGFFNSFNCRARPNFLGSVAGRLGAAFGPSGRTLIYGKAGVAFSFEDDSVTRNLFPDFPDTIQRIGRNHGEVGWTAGFGAEHAFAPAWTFKVEYGFYDFSHGGSIRTPTTFSFDPAFPFIVPGRRADVDEQFHVVKVGLNYRFGMDPWARWDTATAMPVSKGPAMPMVWVPTWEFEFGIRYWGSSGKWQKDLQSPLPGALKTTLISRLTYDGLTGHSGELFGRVDSPWGFFIKGNGGGGIITGGNLWDEDWLVIPTYSNTASEQRDGKLAYATIDVGYDLLRGRDHKIGAFVGYNYFHQDLKAFGCVQNAAFTFGPCGVPIPRDTLVITETTRYDSLRVGLNGEVMLLDKLKLTGDAAYLPFVRFRGTDDHVIRTDVLNTRSPERGDGQGVQLETILSYYVTPQFSVGIGGRYWGMWATHDAFTNIFGTACPCQTLPTYVERYGAFFQAAWKFDEPTRVMAKY